MPPDLPCATLAAAADLIRRRQLSPVELTRVCLERIEAINPRLNAFIAIAAEEALAAARQAAEEIARGRYRGALHGVPVALKDLFHVAGLPTTAGSRILADNVADADSDTAARLKDAGAVLVGKLNLHEFAFGATGVNPHYGPCRNPWAIDHITGGSSSGSGAAVAAGLCFAALGTDTGGSVRIPASLCGVTGLKPTYGRVSRRGLLPLSWSLDHVGPLTRSAEDAALVLQAIAGPDPADPSSSHHAVPDYAAGLARGPAGLRIGIPREFFFQGLDPDVDSAVRAAIAVLESLGAHLREVSLPLITSAPSAVAAIMLPEALAYHHRWLAQRPDDYGDDVRQRLEMAALYPAVAYVQAQRFREMIVTAWQRELFSEVDLLVTPTTAIPSPRIDGADLNATLSLIRLTNPLNLLGLPAVSVPCGFTSDGLPIGLQLVGGWFDETTVLAVAHAYQRATNWHTRTPSL